MVWSVGEITGSIAQAYEEAFEYTEALELYRQVLALEEGRPVDQCDTLSHITGTYIQYRTVLSFSVSDPLASVRNWIHPFTSSDITDPFRSKYPNRQEFSYVPSDL